MNNIIVVSGLMGLEITKVKRIKWDDFDYLSLYINEEMVTSFDLNRIRLKYKYTDNRNRKTYEPIYK